MARKTLAIAVAAVATVRLLLGIYHSRERFVGGMGGKRGAIRALSSLRIQTYYQNVWPDPYEKTISGLMNY